MPSKSEILRHSNVTAGTGLSGKSITAVDVYIHGIVTVIEITHSGGTQFIKVKQGNIEYGGDANFGTGTEVKQ